MKTLKFKTNIKCPRCREKVKSFLENKEGILEWDVDLRSTDKVLTIETENLQPEDIEKLVEEAGFKAEEKKEGFFSKIFG